MSEFSSLATKTSDMQLAPTTSARSEVKAFSKNAPHFLTVSEEMAKAISSFILLENTGHF